MKLEFLAQLNELFQQGPVVLEVKWPFNSHLNEKRNECTVVSLEHKALEILIGFASDGEDGKSRHTTQPVFCGRNSFSLYDKLQLNIFMPHIESCDTAILN